MNSETYISLRHQELRTYKNIGYELYFKELFVVKHKSKFSCESPIYFNLGSEIIKENSNFVYYFNKTDIKPVVLDEIIFVNWTDNKHNKCNINNDIPVKMPNILYVLVNRSVLCNCKIEAENHFLLEFLTTYYNAESKLVMYFMVNTAFVNYHNNLTNSLKFPILLNWTTHEQTLSISLQSFDFNLALLKAPKTLRDFVYQFWHKSKVFICKKT